MEYISESEKLIIQTIAGYVLMGDLEQNKILPKKMWTEYVDNLNEIQKEIVSLFEIEKNNLMEKIQEIEKPNKF
jgi:ADP-heptose:LPS heptosyltransferase